MESKENFVYIEKIDYIISSVFHGAQKALRMDPSLQDDLIISSLGPVFANRIGQALYKHIVEKFDDEFEFQSATLEIRSDDHSSAFITKKIAMDGELPFKVNLMFQNL